MFGLQGVVTAQTPSGVLPAKNPWMWFSSLVSLEGGGPRAGRCLGFAPCRPPSPLFPPLWGRKRRVGLLNCSRKKGVAGGGKGHTIDGPGIETENSKL